MRLAAVLQADRTASFPDSMKRRTPVILLLFGVLLGALFATAQAASASAPPRPPKAFFGIDPQGGLSSQDAEYMKAGGIESVRSPMAWSAIQPTAKGGYDWSSFDPIVEVDRADDQ